MLLPCFLVSFLPSLTNGLTLTELNWIEHMLCGNNVIDKEEGVGGGEGAMEKGGRGCEMGILQDCLSLSCYHAFNPGVYVEDFLGLDLAYPDLYTLSLDDR